MNKNNIEKLLFYYENEIESCLIKIKNSKDNNSNFLINKLIINMTNKINSSTELIEVLNNFFNRKKIYFNYRNYIIDYVTNNFDKIINLDKDDTFMNYITDFKKNILSNNILNKEYILLYSNNYWANYAFKNNLSKKDIIKLAQNHNCDTNDLLLLEKSLNFEKIPTKDELEKAKEELVDYIQIYSLKQYIENWRNIKTSQINNSMLPQDTKIKYFKELEDDYSNLLIYFDDNFKDLKKLFEQINSRDYMKDFIIEYNTNDNKKEQKTVKSKNTINDELMNIKTYQNIMNKPKKY